MSHITHVTYDMSQQGLHTYRTDRCKQRTSTSREFQPAALADAAPRQSLQQPMDQTAGTDHMTGGSGQEPSHLCQPCTTGLLGIRQLSPRWDIDDACPGTLQ